MKKIRFILIDDDHVNNALCSYLIRSVMNNADIMEFNDAEQGLAYMQLPVASHAGLHSVVLLNINMPGMNGWEFLGKFAGLPTDIREVYSIYVATASPDKHDRQKAKDSSFVKEFWLKPITKKEIKDMIERESVHI